MNHFPPRKIMVAFDRSALSMAAWRHALVFADRCQAELEVVYVEPWASEGPISGGGLYMPPGLTPALSRNIRAGIRAKLGARPRILVTEGEAAHRILHLARARRADLIVMGTHGRRGLPRMLLGSTAETVVRSSPVPVLVARGGTGQIRSILAPVHFTSYSDCAFAFAADVAATVGARLTALHVDVDPINSGNVTMRLRRLVETVAPRRVRIAARVLAEEDACRGIIRGAAGHDLIVLSGHAKSGLQGALFGTTAEKVLRSTHKSLLIVPSPKHEPLGARRPAKMYGAKTYII
jgi:nucleotide-binding universal stress UspA family protein